ncbi:NH(3)-dependent NAD(+) synthetase [Haladaptatus sp. R4]|uniref:NAD+ synthase n=1 Tax=Haladaptatus sp. R4 TaxID=1679489 RepID=UPI0007B45E61|nr:NAD+ synthase [Haladaptatus sp. R4]KZN26133.1 NH(3)-dependent NAD(+) synthetase [Haladaptatus sp. R4]
MHRVALVQSNYTVGDIEDNERKIKDGIRRAREENADLVVFSELALVGYPPQDLVKRESFIETQLAALDRIAEEATDITAIVGFVARNADEYGKGVQNAVAICRDGTVVGRTEKRLLPTYDVFDEDRFFEPATSQPLHTLGDGTELGVSICEDAWNEPDVWERPEYDEDPIEDLVTAGADLLVNSSASPFYGGKGEFREQLFGAHASDHGKWLVFVNQVGANDELIFDGRSFVVAPDGTIACRLATFEEDFAVYDVPLDAESPATVNIAPEPPVGAAEIRSALALGIRDYVHKTGFEDVLVGLSGGIDSSLTAALAVDALGQESVLGVAMPTRYTSDESEIDARELADNLDIDFLDIPIEDTFESFEAELAPVLDEEPSVTEENVQARIRATTLMAIANEQGRLLLATSNRSELAIGYTTLYGDMCGSLAPIADCPKTFVYELANRMNASETTIPERVIEKPPSAELRADQTDEDDLPPYEVLDSILAGYVDEGLTADELVESGYDHETVRRVLSMLHRSEYKRFQAAPVLKVSPKAFGVGWRYPLAAKYESTLPE